MLVLGTKKIGIKFLNKVNNWAAIKDLWNKANPKLFKGEPTAEFNNMSDAEATKCC